MKRYIDEVYDSTCCLIDGDLCCIRGCKEKPVDPDGLWVHVSGKEMFLKFCKEHEKEEYESEELYLVGA